MDTEFTFDPLFDPASLNIDTFDLSQLIEPPLICDPHANNNIDCSLHTCADEPVDGCTITAASYSQRCRVYCDND